MLYILSPDVKSFIPGMFIPIAMFGTGSVSVITALLIADVDVLYATDDPLLLLALTE